MTFVWKGIASSRSFLVDREWNFTAIGLRYLHNQLLKPTWNQSRLGVPRAWRISRDCVRCLDQGQGAAVPAGLRQTDLVVRSPYPDLVIPDNVSLSHLLLTEFQKHGNTVALVDGVTGQEMTYSQLHTSVVRVTSALVKLGLCKGDVVAIYSPNCLQFVIATLAIVAAGAAFSSVNPSYTAGELKNALNRIGAKFLLSVPALVPVAMDAVKQSPTVKEIIVFGKADKCRPFSSLLEDDMTSFPANLDFRPKDDIAALPFSSGTSGLPKAVMLSHYNLVANVLQSREDVTLGYKPNQDCILAILPFFHIYGQTIIMMSGLFCGVKVVSLPKFEPTSFMEAIQKYHPTYLPIAPPLVLFLARNPLVLNYDVSSIQQVVLGAAPLSLGLVHEFLGRFSHEPIFRQGYGLTETSPLVSLNGPKSTKYHTCGPAVNNTKFKVVDLETRELLGPGKSGEICVQGPQVMIGYYEDKNATDETIVNGWLHTGDIGQYDKDGHLIVEDRVKDMIKVKGFQVAPAELEAVIIGHPSVQDAAVVGVKDERLGEAPRAFVVLKPQAKLEVEDLKKYVADKVAPFKALAGGVEFRSEIPKSPAGKILRKNLRAEVNKN